MRERRRPPRPGAAASGAGAAALGAGVFLAIKHSPRYGEIARLGVVNEQFFPVQAADFIVREGLGGNVFNLYDWGGYLLWRLAPAKVFIDGRNADRSRFEVYTMVLTGRPASWGSLWKGALSAGGIHVTVTDFSDPFSGELRALVVNLLADPDWFPVFASPTTVVFALQTPETRDGVRRNAIPKDRFYRLLIGFCSEMIESSPRFVPAYVARGDILLQIGDRAAALRSYLGALEIAPDHRLARARVSQILASGGR